MHTDRIKENLVSYTAKSLPYILASHDFSIYAIIYCGPIPI